MQYVNFRNTKSPFQYCLMFLSPNSTLSDIKIQPMISSCFYLYLYINLLFYFASCCCDKHNNQNLGKKGFILAYRAL